MTDAKLLPPEIYVKGHNAYEPNDVWSFEGYYTKLAKDAGLPRYVLADPQPALTVEANENAQKALIVLNTYLPVYFGEDGKAVKEALNTISRALQSQPVEKIDPQPATRADTVDQTLVDELAYLLRRATAQGVDWSDSLMPRAVAALAAYDGSISREPATDPDKPMRYKPSEDYATLRKQFIALQGVLYCKEQEAAHYRAKNYETGEKNLAALQESLESERAMNAQLTAELEARKP
jgi:hypothetical protein